MAKVTVVDDLEVERVGRETMVVRAGHEVRAMTWDEVVGCDVDGDLVIVVVRADRTTWDRYGVLRTVGDIRRRVAAGARVVGVVDRRAHANPMIGLRLAAAGIAEILRHDQLETSTHLDDLVAGRLVGLDTWTRTHSLAALGAGRRCDPSRVVERILELGGGDGAYLRAFAPGYRQKESGLSRRRAHTLRVKVAEAGDLLPPVGRATGGPVRDDSLPRWSDVVAFVNLCRGWHPTDPPEVDEDCELHHCS